MLQDANDANTLSRFSVKKYVFFHTNAYGDDAILRDFTSIFFQMGDSIGKCCCMFEDFFL